MHRKDDDARGAAPGADHLRRFGAVHLRHRLVHHHHVGLGVDRAAHRIESIVGDGHHFHVALSVDQRAQAVGDDAVIIRQQHLDRHSAILTVRRVPPAASAPTGSGSTLNAPPTAWPRSRIVTRPSPGPSGASADFGRPMPPPPIDTPASPANPPRGGAVYLALRTAGSRGRAGVAGAWGGPAGCPFLVRPPP